MPGPTRGVVDRLDPADSLNRWLAAAEWKIAQLQAAAPRGSHHRRRRGDQLSVCAGSGTPTQTVGLWDKGSNHHVIYATYGQQS